MPDDVTDPPSDAPADPPPDEEVSTDEEISTKMEAAGIDPADEQADGVRDAIAAYIAVLQSAPLPRAVKYLDDLTADLSPDEVTALYTDVKAHATEVLKGSG